MNSTGSTTRRALISVSDKSGLDRFAKSLISLGFELLSTGGTRKYLESLGLPVIDVTTYTGFPEVMDGRVKTLHPKVHGAILGRPDLPADAEVIRQHGIVPFELVVVNLYPFEKTVARPETTDAEAIEQIDIGGPSMVRSAAKNHAYVGVVTSPEQYDRVLAELQGSGENGSQLSAEFRRALATAAFQKTAAYDAAIFDYLSKPRPAAGENVAETSPFPSRLQLSFRKVSDLRYGENPHQSGAFYVEPIAPPATLAAARQIHGKELSYNNLLDLDSAMAIARDFNEPAAVVIKHNNPCGCAIGSTLSEAYRKAHEGDPVSAFGSVLAFNRPVDVATAEQLCLPDKFIEAIIAPSIENDAFSLLTTKPKWRNNVRLLVCDSWSEARPASLEYRRVSGGLLVQDRDETPDPESEWKVVTERAPMEAELADLRFAWAVCRHVKSNAIVYVRDTMVVGVGAGQMSRLDSARIAAEKAGERSQGGAVGSDAFFPFRDGIDAAAKAGIRAAIQPGGSRNDAEVIQACNEHGIAMIFTGHRHFKH